MTREVQQSHRVGNDPVLKRSFKPYLTTNAAAPLFWKILGENECKSVFRSHLAGDWRISCSPESISAHFWGSSGARSQSVQNALFNSPTFTFTPRRLKIKCGPNLWHKKYGVFIVITALIAFYISKVSDVSVFVMQKN